MSIDINTIAENRNVEQLKNWLHDKNCAVFFTSQFSITLLNAGKEQIHPRYNLNYLAFKELIYYVTGNRNQKIHYLTSYRLTPDDPGTAPELKLIDWIGNHGFTVLKRPRKIIKIRSGGVKTVSPTMSVYMTSIAHSLYMRENPATHFLILDTVAETAALVEILRKDFEKYVIVGDIIRDKGMYLVDSDLKREANDVINFSDPDILKFLQRQMDENYIERMAEEDEGLKRTLAK